MKGSEPKLLMRMNKRIANHIMDDINHKALHIPTEKQLRKRLGPLDHLDTKTDLSYSHYKAKVRNNVIISDIHKLIQLAKQYHNYLHLYFYYVVPSMQNCDMQNEKVITRNNQNPYRLQTKIYKAINKRFKKSNRKYKSYLGIISEHQETNTDSLNRQFNLHDNYLIVSTEHLDPTWLNTFIYGIYHKISKLKVNVFTSELGHHGKRETTDIDNLCPKVESAPFIPSKQDIKAEIEDEAEVESEADNSVDYIGEQLSQLPSIKHLPKAPKQIRDNKEAYNLGFLTPELLSILHSQHGKGIRLMHKTNFKTMKNHLLKILFNTDDLGFDQKGKVRTENGITTGVLKLFKLKKHKFKGNLSKFFKRKRIKARQQKWNQLVTTIISNISKFNNDSTVKHSPKLAHVYSAADNNKLSVKHRQRGENQSHMHCQTQNCKRWEADQLNTHTQHFRIWGSKGSLDNQTMNINLVAGGLNFQTQEQYLGAELSYGLAVHSMARPKGEKSTANLLQLWRLKPT